VASPQLKALYLESAKMDPECVPILQDEDLRFILWPDARREGIAMEPSNLPRSVSICVVAMVIPLPRLRQLGVEPALLDAIAAAHNAKLYDPIP